jgi:Di-haem oxidoreductase, putative peroxidase
MRLVLPMALMGALVLAVGLIPATPSSSEAIVRHQREAQKAANRFKMLPAKDREALLAFLQSL